MAKPEWGNKRRCLSCSAAFYDLNKSPILCPKCGTEFNPDVLVKSRRPAKPEEAKPAPKPPKPAATDDVDTDIEDSDIGDDVLEDEEDFDEDDVSEEIDVDAAPDGEEER
ncbi:TIGR02300 family protein [Ferrovibrio sp.]|uniref:TIGR02300 family protein n=1 Tax=Ferrovibrio sp. TaxID=1917215 RepID=UPI00311E8EC8